MRNVLLNFHFHFTHYPIKFLLGDKMLTKTFNRNGTIIA